MKQILITGASSGIGAETAILLAEHGYELILTARRDHLLRELALKCEELGALRADTIAGDILDVAANPRLVDLLKGEGEIVLVNNAGVARFGGYIETDWNGLQEQVSKNLLGPMAVTHAVLPGMLAAGSGLIVNVASIAAKTAFTGSAAYSASKAGLVQFGSCIREEYRRQGIRVCNIVPGATDTAIWGDDPAQSPPREKMLPARAVADAIAWVVAQHRDRVVEEIVVTPPDGVL